MSPMMVGTAMCRDESLEGGEFPAPIFGSDLGGSSQPSRGLLYSLIVHGLLAAIFFGVPWNRWLPSEAHLATPQSMIQQRHEVLLLPKLEPMGSGAPAAPSSHGENAKKDDDLDSAYDAKALRGVVYKGEQLIVSNSPHPDNFVQTIRQPDLASKPKLPAPLPLPPMVSLAPAKQIVAPPMPQPTPDVSRENQPLRIVATALLIVPQQVRVEAPKLPLPAASSAEALLHAAASTAVPAPMPGLAHQNPPVKTGKDAHNILVVDAISRPDPKPSAIPPGELFGTFTVSPTGATAIGLAGGGTESKGAPGITNASGNGASPYAGNGSKSSSRTNEEDKTIRVGVGPGTGAGHGSTDSAHGSSLANGKEAGTSSGAGGHAIGTGSGRGAGSGSGSSPFPSIMIQGGTGVSGRGIARVPANAVSAKPQSSYGMTIVANGASGGGFKDMGVFRSEASYTVYLDMADAGASGSSWTLQYALDRHRTPGSSDSAPHAQGSLAPPYATAKSLPHVSSEAAKRGRGGTIVVFGVINTQGKFEDLRVMQSPDASLNQSLLDSLRKWAFRPAEMNGAQVPVKVLLGVSVNSLPGD